MFILLFVIGSIIGQEKAPEHYFLEKTIHSSNKFSDEAHQLVDQRMSQLSHYINNPDMLFKESWQYVADQKEKGTLTDFCAHAADDVIVVEPHVPAFKKRLSALNKLIQCLADTRFNYEPKHVEELQAIQSLLEQTSERLEELKDTTMSFYSSCTLRGENPQKTIQEIEQSFQDNFVKIPGFNYRNIYTFLGFEDGVQKSVEEIIERIDDLPLHDGLVRQLHYIFRNKFTKQRYDLILQDKFPAIIVDESMLIEAVQSIGGITIPKQIVDAFSHTLEEIISTHTEKAAAAAAVKPSNDVDVAGEHALSFELFGRRFRVQLCNPAMPHSPA